MGISKNDFDKRMNYPETSKPAVRSQINGIPIYQFGNAAFYSESPKLIDDDIVQINNKNNPEKCRLKKSWEIKKNYIGATTPRMPCTPANDFHPLQCINLIDGNDDTCWMSMRHNIPDEQPEWIRIDLAKEREIHKIILKKRSNIPSETRDSKYYNSLIGCAIPSHLTIKVSSDAHDWKTVFEGDPYAGAENDVNRHIFEIDIAALRVKQIWIIGDVLSKCDMGYAFSIASVELYDEKKRNVALASYGNGITASSIFYYVQQERETFDWFWPLHFDLGLTWSRIGYHNDMINWHWIEQEKGVLKIDEEAEKAIDLLVKNGVNIVYVLAFGNRLYQESPVRDISFHQWQSAPPKSDEALVGWENFVRFSVNYFKDRIEYFEIWNEWNGPDYWGAVPDTEHYIKLAKITARIIRECAPDAKVILGSYAGFCHGISKWSETEIAEKEKNYDFFQVISALAPLVDVIGFHPWYGSVDTKSEYYMEYTDNLRAFKRYCESKGFTGKRYMASEFNVSANYPPMSAEGGWNWSYPVPSTVGLTEITKAKILAQILVKHTALGIESFFCELFQKGYIYDLSLMRRTFSSYPICPMNPQAAYYVMRNLASVLDGFEPAEFSFSASCGKELEIWPLTGEGKNVLAVWLKGEVSDDCDGKSADITFDFTAASADAYNPMTGELIPLTIETKKSITTVKGIIVRDYPLLLKFNID